MEWNGQLFRAKVVAYRSDAGSGLSSARKPVSLVWVKNDGTVIRQDMSLASVRVQFIRQPSESPSTSFGLEQEERARP
jgi:hypothetical protein